MKRFCFEIRIFWVKKRQNGDLEVLSKKRRKVMECQIQHMPRGFAVSQRLWFYTALDKIFTVTFDRELLEKRS